MSRLLMVDIETAPIDGVEQHLGHIQAPANYSKPESIAKYIDEKTAEEKDKASLDPDLCRIVAIAFQFQGEDTVRGNYAKTEADEKALLERFWQIVRAEPLVPNYCGFNIAGFDIPVLLRRSLFLGVSAPKIRLGRYAYQMPNVWDLQNFLTLDRHEKFRLRSKDWWLKRLGIVGADNPCTGADVAALIAVGDFDTVLAHCKADVANEVLLARWLDIWA
jgi:predicted PolB exonuclease-like 3'-5' exonuclease